MKGENPWFLAMGKVLFAVLSCSLISCTELKSDYNALRDVGSMFLGKVGIPSSHQIIR